MVVKHNPKNIGPSLLIQQEELIKDYLITRPSLNSQEVEKLLLVQLLDFLERDGLEEHMPFEPLLDYKHIVDVPVHLLEHLFLGDNLSQKGL